MQTIAIRSSVAHLEFPVVEFPSWGVVVSVVSLDTHAACLQSLAELLTLTVEILTFLLSQGSCDATWNYHRLQYTTQTKIISTVILD